MPGVRWPSEEPLVGAGGGKWIIGTCFHFLGFTEMPQLSAS